MSVLNINDQIGGYWIKNLIKSNSYTETYRVEDANSRPFFLKLFKMKELPSYLLLPDTKIVKEIEYCSNLQHRNLLSFVESGSKTLEEGDIQYYITNYFNGAILSDVINRNGPMGEEDALSVFRNILNGLVYLQSQSPALCHNDLDPSNIMLSDTTGDAIIIDLGHISTRNSGFVPFNTSDLDAFYHANETHSGIFDEQSDVFSACGILYYTLTANHPWCTELSGDSFKEQIKYLWQYRKEHSIAIDTLNISDKLKFILKRGLALRRTERFESAKEIIDILDSELQQDTKPEKMNSIENGSSERPKSKPYINPDDPNYVEFQIKQGTGKGFEDIAGMGQLKETLKRQVIFVLQNPDIAKEYRLTTPNGMLLYGPPGCGKTFFAEKFAEEVGFKYVLVKSSDLATSLVHGGQQKIRQLFDQAEQNAPIVVCLDEFDALVPTRSWNSHSSEEVNEFLSQMNNCSQRGIFIVATTNRPDKIDIAVKRTGRLDKMVYVPLPDEEARREMFELYLKDRPLEEDINIQELAELTDGYVASDIAYIVNDTAGLAAYTKSKISFASLQSAIKDNPPSLNAEILKEYEALRKQMDNTNRRISAENKIVNW